MTYLFIILVIFFITVATMLYIARRKKRKAEKEVEQSWGKTIIRFRDMESIKYYHDCIATKERYKLTPQTLADIDIEALFAFVDRTQSTIGRQYLYSIIASPILNINELKLRHTATEYFLQHTEERKKIQLILYELEKMETQLLANFFDPETVIVPQKHGIYFKILTSLAIVSVFTCWIYPLIALIMIFLFGTNLLIHLIFRNNNNYKLKAIRQVRQLQKTTERVQAFEIPINQATIPKASKELSKFRRIYSWLDFAIPADDVSMMLFLVFDLVKSFFLTEIHLLNAAYNEVIKNKKAVEEFYIYIGKAELAITTASVKSGNIITCTPDVAVKSKMLSTKGCVHPLIENCIPNSLTLDNTNAFITGSNMSGKSTFLRTVFINAIMAQSLHICFAKNFEAPLFHFFSSIKIGDNLQGGTSYYFEEVNLIHEMVIHSKMPQQNLFVIDEIFKGTNTVERIALSKAILKYLDAPNNIIIASSHDIELIELLRERFELYHFEESIVDDRLFFDHTIKAGPLKSTNAIKIIELEGFPVEVVEDAKILAEKLKK